MRRIIIVLSFLWMASGFLLAQAQQSALVGTVSDASTTEPVEFAQVLLEEINRSSMADEGGRFELLFIPPGSYTLKAFRIGYQPLIRSVRVPAGDTLRLQLTMTVSPLEAGEVIVEGARTDARQLADAAMEMEGRKLRQKLGTTIAETLADEPGLAMRSMGPAPARPILRGLGGERLLVLEDGGRTGDLSATSTDHAVVIEPLTADRIEVVRGPAALVYGPNTLGGVVNVVRGYIPNGLPRRAQTGVSVQGQSVNRGFSGGFGTTVPVGSFALRTDGSIRRAADVMTPVGPLQNTDLWTLNASAGASVVRPWGYVGAAAGYYESSYGIPGGFVGAHPDGVNIELTRSHLEVKSEIVEPLRFIPRLELGGTFSRYHHQEFEDEETLGIEYGLVSYHGRALVHIHPNGHLRKGAFGLWGEIRDFAAGGFSFTPNSTEFTIAGFGYQDIHFDRFTFQAGARYDLRSVQPGIVGETSIGNVRARTFSDISASIRGMLHPIVEVSIGATLMRSLRMPGIEELYSRGPHLAAYSFEVGNPDLGSEIGWGFEVFGGYEGRRVSGSVAMYANLFQQYIYPRDTGEIDVRTLLPIFQQTGAEARMEGIEAAIEVRPHRMIQLAVSTSYTRGTFTDTDEPLPWIPPLSGEFDASLRVRDYTFGANLVGALPQDRVAEREETTDGYMLAGLYVQYHFTTGAILHTVDVAIDNLTDAEYRDHLSRVKSVMPEPGRNVKLLYRVFF